MEEYKLIIRAYSAEYHGQACQWTRLSIFWVMHCDSHQINNCWTNPLKTVSMYLTGSDNVLIYLLFEKNFKCLTETAYNGNWSTRVDIISITVFKDATYFRGFP